MENFKAIFLLIVCTLALLSGVGMCNSQISDLLNEENFTSYDFINIQKPDFLQAQLQISNNGFNPNKKKKC